jgi:hypothetical protein
VIELVIVFCKEDGLWYRVKGDWLTCVGHTKAKLTRYEADTLDDVAELTKKYAKGEENN